MLFFISVCLISFIMESFTAGYMFGNGSSTTHVVERSTPSTEIVLFEIPIGIVDRVMCGDPRLAVRDLQCAYIHVPMISQM